MIDKLNIANRERGTMNNAICEPNEDLAVAILPDGQTTVLDREDETAEINACEYCDRYPCGCGG